MKTIAERPSYRSFRRDEFIREIEGNQYGSTIHPSIPPQRPCGICGFRLSDDLLYEEPLPGLALKTWRKSYWQWSGYGSGTLTCPACLSSSLSIAAALFKLRPELFYKDYSFFNPQATTLYSLGASYDDAQQVLRLLRLNWARWGMPWMVGLNPDCPPPEDWNPERQMRDAFGDDEADAMLKQKGALGQIQNMPKQDETMRLYTAWTGFFPEPLKHDNWKQRHFNEARLQPCPICGMPGQYVHDKTAKLMYIAEQCVCCMVEFTSGVTMGGEFIPPISNYAVFRREWVRWGMPWHWNRPYPSPPPDDWNPQRNLRNLLGNTEADKLLQQLGAYVSGPTEYGYGRALKLALRKY